MVTEEVPGHADAKVSSVTCSLPLNPEALDVRRRRNRESMRRARVRQQEQKLEMQLQIRQLETQLAELIATSHVKQSNSLVFGQLLQQTEQLRTQKRELEDKIQQFENFRAKLHVEQQEDKERKRLAKRELEVDANRSSTPEQRNEKVPGRPVWVSANLAQELLQFATKMFLDNAARTDALVPRANVVLGWRDKRAIVDDTWAQFLLIKEFPRQLAASLVEKTWKATVNVNEMREMLKWTAGMEVRHQLSENAYVVSRELHLPNSTDADHPIRYKYQLVIFRAETPNGFIISTQNINLTADTTVAQMLDQRLLRLASIPLVTMYGFQFERQYCDKTGEEVGCRVKLAGRTSDGSLSYAHNVLTEALPSILRWENTYVGPILCVTST
ncbi:hypothetical protein P3T76_007839 [Phytophthora citrophthora]|uniref:BZIP domain-containing protein n=1 Tax=Phytophthora citrophthora TaxID=4793 RepID=A0AAD9GN31_9STRA|nr:hypothetical protein P3T76_007839 [Phytophthora citrophthora]